MRIIECKQGSIEWNTARLGIPTASNFDRIITPGGKPCKGDSATKYRHRLVAEALLECGTEEVTSAAMNRGTELEADAVTAYEFMTGNTAGLVGFCLEDRGRYGASPDRLVGDDGLLEVKCPLPHTHVGYMLQTGIPDAYYPQIQGQLLVTGREWCDSISFCPGLPLSLVRCGRDDGYIDLLSNALMQFCAELAEDLARARKMMDGTAEYRLERK